MRAASVARQREKEKTCRKQNAISVMEVIPSSGAGVFKIHHPRSRHLLKAKKGTNRKRSVPGIDRISQTAQEHLETILKPDDKRKTNELFSSFVYRLSSPFWLPNGLATDSASPLEA
jgi:hypothetical protein